MEFEVLTSRVRKALQDENDAALEEFMDELWESVVDAGQVGEPEFSWLVDILLSTDL